MEKIFIVSEDEELNYVSEISDNKIKLRYSDSDIWTSHTKGTDIGVLKDTGNNIKVSIGEKKISLDYDEFVELAILIDLKMKKDSNLVREIKYLKEHHI